MKLACLCLVLAFLPTTLFAQTKITLDGNDEFKSSFWTDGNVESVLTGINAYAGSGRLNANRINFTGFDIPATSLPGALESIAGLSGTSGNYIRFTGVATVEQRTPAQVMSDIGLAGHDKLTVTDGATSVQISATDGIHHTVRLGGSGDGGTAFYDNGSVAWASFGISDNTWYIGRGTDAIQWQLLINQPTDYRYASIPDNSGELVVQPTMTLGAWAVAASSTSFATSQILHLDDAETGGYKLATLSVVSGNSKAIALRSGDSSEDESTSGNLEISTGEALGIDGDSGNIRIFTGTANNNLGSVQIDGGDSSRFLAQGSGIQMVGGMTSIIGGDALQIIDSVGGQPALAAASNLRTLNALDGNVAVAFPTTSALGLGGTTAFTNFTLEVQSENTDAGLILTPQGAGEVFIGSTVGGSTLRVDDIKAPGVEGRDMAISGGVAESTFGEGGDIFMIAGYSADDDGGDLYLAGGEGSISGGGASLVLGGGNEVGATALISTYGLGASSNNEFSPTGLHVETAGAIKAELRLSAADYDRDLIMRVTNAGGYFVNAKSNFTDFATYTFAEDEMWLDGLGDTYIVATRKWVEDGAWLDDVGTVSGVNFFTTIGGTADSMPYLSATNTWSLTSTSAMGRAFLAVTPSSGHAYYVNGSTWTATGTSTAGRNLWAVGGTSGTFPYLSGTDTWSLATVTAAGRDMTAAATTSAQWNLVRDVGILSTWMVAPTGSQSNIAATFSSKGSALTTLSGTSVSVSASDGNLSLAGFDGVNLTSDAEISLYCGQGITLDTFGDIEINESGTLAYFNFYDNNSNVAFSIDGDTGIAAFGAFADEISTSQVFIRTTDENDSNLLLQSITGQVSNVLEIQNDVEDVTASIDTAGNVIAASYSTSGPVAVGSDVAVVTTSGAGVAFALPLTGNLINWNGTSATTVTSVSNGQLGIEYTIFNESNYDLTFTHGGSIYGAGGASVTVPKNTKTTLLPLSSTKVLVGDMNGAAGQYAMLVIPFPHGEDFTDFELKVTSTNFTGDQINDVLFFYHSPDPQAVVGPDDYDETWSATPPQVYYMDSGVTSGHPNQRGLFPQAFSGSIMSQLIDVNSVCSGVVVVIKNPGLHALKKNLIFSYSLFDGGGAELDGASRQIWRPVLPSQWVSEFDPNNQP